MMIFSLTFISFLAMLKSKLMDPDEKVRVAAIKAIGIICKGHPNILDDETFNEVAARCRDKKVCIPFSPNLKIASIFSRIRFVQPTSSSLHLALKLLKYFQSSFITCTIFLYRPRKLH